MDEHIARVINNNDNDNDNNEDQIQIPSPADLLGEFCWRRVEILKMEIDRLIYLEEFSEDPSLIKWEKV